MLFNSVDFALFLPIVFLLYWFVIKANIKRQNILVILASYLFYGWWDYRFLSLIIISTLVDYVIGTQLGKVGSDNKRKMLLWCSIIVNLGFLGFFKYFDFFQENFVKAFSFFGQEIKSNSLNIVLPVGISFYTFQTLSYTIDVYKRKLNPTNDFIAFAAFVSFFPQLVAGPIERAVNLLPQFYKKRVFSYEKAVDGMRQMLWGLFKKIVIADNCAEYANLIFNNSDKHSGSTLVFGALFFSFQIYGDFSGYSDIAIGTSRLFGFDLKKNFSYPYFSRDIAEFWRRWHISLSTWFRDYLYIPLGGGRMGTKKNIRNVLIVFVVSGLWHGAEWTFIAWGIIHALYFLPLLLLNKNRVHINTIAEGRVLPSLKEFISMLFTFFLCAFAWIFFRAESIGHAFSIIAEIASPTIIDIPDYVTGGRALTTLFFVGCFILIEWLGRDKPYALATIGENWHFSVKFALYYFILFIIFRFGGAEQQFIYFQF